MSDFDESMIQRLKRLEREVERLQKWERPIVITDHGALGGLGDNDHPQYLLTTGKAADSDKLDGIDSTGFAIATHNHTGVYLPIAGKAADSDKLDGVDITAFLGLNSLTDPDADRVLFWDDSAGLLKWLTLGTGLSITDTTISATQPAWQSWTPTFTGWTGSVIGVFRSIQIGKIVFDSITITAGTSNATTATATLSHTSANITNKVWDGACGRCVDNTVILTTACRWEVAANSNVVNFYSNMGTGTWTNSGTKLMRAIVIYEVA